MGAYDDIINLPHHVSTRHPRMPAIDRAAQFSPFAALTGFEGAIREAGRLTDSEVDLSEDQKVDLDARLRMLEDVLPQHPKVTVVYYVPDKYKSGGAYISVSGEIKKIDRIGSNIILQDNTAIPIDSILQIDSRYLDKNE